MLEIFAKRSAGLDVHKKMVMVTVLNEQMEGSLREVTKEFGVLPKDLERLRNWLLEEQVELAVMESTGVYWKSIFAALEDSGIKVEVVNARHVKKVPGRKTDVLDSQWLARLARFGLLKGSFIPEKDLRELRVVSRYRRKLVGMLASEKNRLNKVLDDAGVRLGNVVTDIHGISAQGIIDGLINGERLDELLSHVRGRLHKKTADLKEVLVGQLSERHRFVLKQITSHIQDLESRLKETETYLFTAMEPYQAQWKLLQTIPGVNAICAAMMIIELGVHMEHFGSREQLASWAGICPGNNESAGKKKSGKTRKGNQQLRTLLCEASNAAIKTDSQFKGKYKGLVIRRGHKRALIAVGHKMLRVVHSLLKNHKPYHDPTISYEELMTRKNASRWMKALVQFGYVQPAIA